jgi:hypothetical protein
VRRVSASGSRRRHQAVKELKDQNTQVTYLIDPTLGCLPGAAAVRGGNSPKTVKTFARRSTTRIRRTSPPAITGTR